MHRFADRVRKIRLTLEIHQPFLKPVFKAGSSCIWNATEDYCNEVLCLNDRNNSLNLIVSIVQVSTASVT